MKQLLFLFFFISAIACHPSRHILEAPYTFENELLDTLVVRDSRVIFQENQEDPYLRATETRKNDLLHTRLDIRFDLESRSVIGIAELELKPYFYPQDQLELDAVNFEIQEILLLGKDQNLKLDYEYDGQKLLIHLDRIYGRDEHYWVQIAYFAFPEINSSEQAFAIGSDQGMFFIDPLDENPSKPTQVWTQGETEYNSRWFPTIDKPNERCTQDLFITVDSSFVTLSNGLLVDHKINMDGSRTDHWKMDLPHAPYLFAIIAGDYSVVKDLWGDMLLEYYVYPTYRESAKKIFDHTGEMLSFFSSLTGVDYPWPKYSQVIVSDFVSGAMENTTAVVFSEAFQKSREELVDFPNDVTVMHELAHHWFGNLVTCESWANLTLNEGFANYAEYLWVEHKFGKDHAEYHRYRELNQYLLSSEYQTHPLIDFNYADKDAMFDAHSYNKGSLILHMLRQHLGDDAFFSAINLYLREHAFDSAEAHDLRLAFEEISGEDLNWFFNQWFFDEGHPIIQANYSFSDSDNILTIEIDQVQDSLHHRRVFQFPFTLQVIYPDGGKQIKKLWIDERNTTLALKLPEKPAVVLFDHERHLLCSIEVPYDEQDQAFIFKNADHLWSRYEAIGVLKYYDSRYQLMEEALSDPFWQIRLTGLQYLKAPYSDSTIQKVREMLSSDPKSMVRSRALRFLVNNDPDLNDGLVKYSLEKDSSSYVISTALNWMYRNDHPETEKYARKWMNSRSGQIEMILAEIFSSKSDPAYLSYYADHIFNGNIIRNASIITAYSKYLQLQDPKTIVSQCRWLHGSVNMMKEGSVRKQFYLRIIEDQLEHLKSLRQVENRSDEKRKLDLYIGTLQKLSRK